ncbi:MAG: Isoquinoline 1-oxidoreductase beta subunit [Caulobacter sp.]|nr:Isoquinoline 1-oxidoreductase beta subunit [Caulobacter sp.]
MTMASLSRRQLLVTAAVAGGGMALGFTAQAAEGRPAEFTPWLTIAPDGGVTVRVTTPDIGNGVATQAAMTVNEELDADWSKVRTEYASTLRNQAEGGVYSAAGGGLAWFSGRSTRDDRMTLQLQVGASARERLRAAAAVRLGAPLSEIEARAGMLIHAPTGRRLGYGEVAAEACAVSLAAEPALKPRAAWSRLGKAAPGRLENPGIVTGKAVYGMDVRLPGMVYAALRQSPVHGGRLKAFDAAAVKGMAGVLAVVTIDPDEPRGAADGAKEPMRYPPFSSAAQSGVAVIAEHYWQARAALEALPVEWDAGGGAAWSDAAKLESAAVAAVEGTAGKTIVSRGAVPETGDGRTVEATYLTPYCEHAAMEPLNGAALVTPGHVEVWHPSQNPAQATWIAADETGLPLSAVTFHQTLVGGAFGRRGFCDDTRMVVAVARKFPGRPVHVIWSREETARQGRYRPLAVGRFRAALDAHGLPTGLSVNVAQAPGFPPLGLIDNAYVAHTLPSVRIDAQTLPFHLLTGSFRGPSYNSYAFMTETFIDECAAAAGADPLAYRLMLLKDAPDPAWARCLQVAAGKAGWGRKAAKGRGLGIAVCNWGGGGKPRSGTTIAAVADVEVSKGGALAVRRVDVAFDCGSMANADGVEAQLVGATLYGLNVALNEALRVKDGAVVDGNFDTYTVNRMADAPPVIVHFDALSGDPRFAEVGEAGVGPIGAAVGNAIFAATGRRLRRQPFAAQEKSWS